MRDGLGRGVGHRQLPPAVRAPSVSALQADGEEAHRHRRRDAHLADAAPVVAAGVAGEHVDAVGVGRARGPERAALVQQREQPVHVAVQRAPQRRAVGLEDGLPPALQRRAAHEREQPPHVDRPVVGVEGERVLPVRADAPHAGDVAVPQPGRGTVAGAVGRVDRVAQRAVGDRDPRAAGGGHRGELPGEHGVGRHRAHDLGRGRRHARPRVRERAERQHVPLLLADAGLQRGGVVAHLGGRPAGGHGQDRQRVAAQCGHAQQDAVQRAQVGGRGVFGSRGGPGAGAPEAAAARRSTSRPRGPPRRARARAPSRARRARA